MIKKQIYTLSLNYEEFFDPSKCNFLKSAYLKYSTQKLNDPIYFTQIGRCGLLYIHVKKSREPPHIF